MAIVRDARAVAFESVYVQVAVHAWPTKWSGCRTALPMAQDVLNQNHRNQVQVPSHLGNRWTTSL